VPIHKLENPVLEQNFNQHLNHQLKQRTHGCRWRAWALDAAKGTPFKDLSFTAIIANCYKVIISAKMMIDPSQYHQQIQRIQESLEGLVCTTEDPGRGNLAYYRVSSSRTDALKTPYRWKPPILTSRCSSKTLRKQMTNKEPWYWMSREYPTKNKTQQRSKQIHICSSYIWQSLLFWVNICQSLKKIGLATSLYDIWRGKPHSLARFNINLL